MHIWGLYSPQRTHFRHLIEIIYNQEHHGSPSAPITHALLLAFDNASAKVCQSRVGKAEHGDLVIRVLLGARFELPIENFRIELFG